VSQSRFCSIFVERPLVCLHKKIVAVFDDHDSESYLCTSSLIRGFPCLGQAVIWIHPSTKWPPVVPDVLSWRGSNKVPFTYGWLGQPEVHYIPTTCTSLTTTVSCFIKMLAGVPQEQITISRIPENALSWHATPIIGLLSVQKVLLLPKMIRHLRKHLLCSFGNNYWAV
jgi:hypothetical protein